VQILFPGFAKDDAPWAPPHQEHAKMILQASQGPA
jgi:hypothetical protein